NVNATSSVNVHLRLLGENGSLFAVADDVRLNPMSPRRQVADFVTNFFPQLAGTTFKGTLVVEPEVGAPTRSLVPIALTVKEGLLSALPVVPVGLPTFQADPIKVTVVHLVPTSDNSRVVLTFTIENTTSVPVYFALQAAAGYLTFALSDDRATVWSLSS